MHLNVKRLDHVTIAVPAGEHDEVRAFYGGLLGLEEIPRPDALDAVYDLLWFRLPGFLLHLVLTPAWVQPSEVPHLALEIENLPTFRRHLESQGATIREAVPMPDRDRFYLLDPFGNYFELIEMHSTSN